MKQTTNYNLSKPEWQDFIDLGPINSNMDVIDSKFKELENANAQILNTELPQCIKFWVSSANLILSEGSYFCLGAGDVPPNYTMGVIVFESRGTRPGENPQDIQTFHGFDNTIWQRNSLRASQYGWGKWEKII